ncbi:MAG: hypothetical protein ACD_19C00182G0030 [uncultured bacterium]|nr:MAG: hypothetical protein ACD_19C00182G0030 [uncultured bacterium]
MIEIQGNYKCARKNMEVVVTITPLGQTEDFITEAHIEAEKTQYVCNQEAFGSCPPNCQIREFVEKTKGLVSPHHPYL